MRALVVVTTLSLLFPLDAQAYGLGTPIDPRLAHIVGSASDFLVKNQLPSGGWTWREGKGPEGVNFSGLVAESLLAAYEQTDDPKYRDAAERYARKLVERYQAYMRARPYKPDIEFLVRVTEVTGQTQYAEVARRWFDNIMLLAPSGAQEVGRIAKGRATISNIVGYDVALGIRAAIAVEAYDYAVQLARAVLNSKAHWLTKPRETYGTISRAALLDALSLLGARKFTRTIELFRSQLIAEQHANGSWCTNETQATAYAVRALDGQGLSSKSAAQRGLEWLGQTVLGRGAWAHYNDGLPEPFVGDVLTGVQAEAISAIIMTNQR
jgi:hypothetical protein